MVKDTFNLLTTLNNKMKFKFDINLSNIDYEIFQNNDDPDNLILNIFNIEGFQDEEEEN